MTVAILTLLLALHSVGYHAEVRTLSVSAYVNSGGQYPFQGLTASGTQTVDGSCACGPSYEFGTVFFVNGRPFVCTDRGGAITDGHLDLWHESEAEAIQFGRQSLSAIIVKP